MNKLLKSLFKKNQPLPGKHFPAPSTSAFQRELMKAKASEEYMPVWEVFVNTQFFVSVIPQDSGDSTSDFRFSILDGDATKGEPMVLIAEELELLATGSRIDKAIRLSGARLVQMLQPEVGILVGLKDEGFGIPSGKVRWLRESIQPVH